MISCVFSILTGGQTELRLYHVQEATLWLHYKAQTSPLVEELFFLSCPSSFFSSPICVRWSSPCHSSRHCPPSPPLLNLPSRDEISRLFHLRMSRSSNRTVSTPLLLTAIRLLSRHGLVEVREGNPTAGFVLTVILITDNCKANSGFKPIAAGGDGGLVQHCAYSLASLALDY